MRKEQFYRDKKTMKRSASGICLVPFLALRTAGCSRTVDQDKAAQKTEQVQGTEKEGVGVEKSNAETEKSDSGIGEASREQPAGSSQVDAKTAAGQGDSVIEFKPGTPVKEEVVVSDFTGESMDGTSITLSELRGRLVIINFWVTWCGPCVKGMPASERLRDDFGNKIGIIAVDCGDDTETVKDFVEENGCTLPVALDEEYSISMLYPTNPIPCIVVLDAEGKATHISTGVLGADTMYERYKEALGV